MKKHVNIRQTYEYEISLGTFNLCMYVSYINVCDGLFIVAFLNRQLSEGLFRLG